MNTRQAIPIVLVSGFLGAGKTTLMRRLIASSHRRKLKTCVIVNEFGASDVDGGILKQADAEMLTSVAGGCACCSGADEFLWTLLDVAERDDETRPDVILVECSGLADPLLMLDSITVTRLLPLVRLGALLTVADASRFEDFRREVMPLLIRQLQLADIVVLNKIDLATSQGNSPEILVGQLQEVAPHALVVPARESEIDFDLLWPRVEQAGAEAVATREPGGAQAKAGAEEAAHAHYRTVVCPLPHPVEISWLRDELGKLGSEVWRAKGFVRVRGEAALHLVQVTNGSSGPRVEVRPFAIFEPGGGEPLTSLVFIGPDLDRAALMQSFGSLGMLPMI